MIEIEARFFRLQAHDAQRKLSVAMWLCISSTYDQHLQMLKCWRCFSLHLGSHSRGCFLGSMANTITAYYTDKCNISVI
ncbi:hypothetical protein AAC387_Pa02g2317 [Persea americana]